MVKRGIKVNYIEFGNEPVQDVVAGHLLGIALNNSTKNYYTMIPKALLPKSEKRSKRKWLGSDLQIAVAKFRAIILKLKGEQEQTTAITIDDDGISKIHRVKVKAKPVHSLDDLRHNLELYANDEDMELQETGRSLVFIKEQEHIEWLKKELQNPIELAKKTGVPELAEIGTILAKDTNIKLSDVLQNYLNKKKTISKKEASDSKTWFETFCDVIECSTVDSINLPCIHKYEDYIHLQGLAPKTIQHRMNKISTIFNYNTGRYNSTHLIQIHNWLKGLDRPEDVKPYNPELMSRENFDKLFAVSDAKWKAMLLLGLNCAMYPIDLSRLEKSNIDFDKGTVSFRRGKTGKVLAVSTLWGRTTKAIQDYLETREDISEHLFITRYGDSYASSSITDYFAATMRTKAGLGKDVKFNHLRDTFATLAQDLEYSIEQINLVLGHKNKGMQDRYAVRQANKLTGEMCKAVEKEFFKVEEETPKKSKKKSKKKTQKKSKKKRIITKIEKIGYPPYIKYSFSELDISISSLTIVLTLLYIVFKHFDLTL
jgi:integrase